MLDALGLSTEDEAVYVAMLVHKDLDIAGLASYLNVDEHKIREALENLIDLALVRVGSGQDQFRPVRPRAGLASLLARAEAEIAARQVEVERARLSVVGMANRFDDDQTEDVRRLEGLDSVQDRMVELAADATSECLSFSTGGAQLPETMEAERPLNLRALERGVTIRNLYLDSYRNDPATVAYANWMAEHGSQSRTVASLPLRMVIVDRKIALVPLDPANNAAGAIEVWSPGVLAGLLALFEQVWSTGVPFGEAPVRGSDGLSQQERELLRLYAVGQTDEAAARKLAISVRSVQRIMTALSEKLGASSRFQAGVEATRRGWI